MITTRSYFIAPTSAADGESAIDRIKRLVDENRIWGFGPRLAARVQMKAGDMICFYAAGVGVVGVAALLDAPRLEPHVAVGNPARFPWTVRLTRTKLFSDPIVVSRDLRGRLDAFERRNLDDLWSWFVQVTHPVTEHDFQLLTGRSR